MKSKSAASRAFDVFNITLMILLSAMFLYPLCYIIALSLSDATAIIEGRVVLFPVKFTTDAYAMLFRDSSIIHSLWSVSYTHLDVYKRQYFYSSAFCSLDVP